MKENIIWTVEGRIREGKQEAFEAVMQDMIAAVKEEEGSLNYEWTLGKDGKSLHVYERYRDVEAAKAHLVTWSRFAGTFMAAVEITRITVFSDLPPELKAGFSGAVFMKPIGGCVK